MERQECVEQKEAILSFCAGVAGAGCARGGWWLVLQHEWLGSLALELTASRKEHCESWTHVIICDHYTWWPAGVCVIKYSYTQAFEVFISSARKHVKAALLHEYYIMVDSR